MKDHASVSPVMTSNDLNNDDDSWSGDSILSVGMGDSSGDEINISDGNINSTSTNINSTSSSSTIRTQNRTSSFTSTSTSANKEVASSN